MRPLSNKAQAVLALLRRVGHGMACKDVAETITAQTPCAACLGSGEGDDVVHGIEGQCKRCWGKGTTWFGYSDAYVALNQLADRGLVLRENVIDSWGDPTSALRWSAIATAVPDDPLEALYLAPSAVRPQA